MEDVEIAGAAGEGKISVFAKFAAELAAAGIDPDTVFVAVDEAHGEPDFEVLAKMAELARSGRSTSIDWAGAWREEMLRRGQVATLEGFQADPQLRAQLAQVTLGGAR